ncbi:hypothetical protein B4Q13_23685, partial [Lacticaseibacillus rhamnosus]
PKGTSLARLARGRERLRSRLTRRGLALSAAGLATALSQCDAAAATPAALVSSTTNAAFLFAAGKATAGLISRSRVAQLRPCKLETEQLKAVTDWVEQVQEILEGNYKRPDALPAGVKQAQKKGRKK